MQFFTTANWVVGRYCFQLCMSIILSVYRVTMWPLPRIPWTLLYRSLSPTWTSDLGQPPILSPVGGGANQPRGGGGGGRQHTKLPNFLKNCMKLGKFRAVGDASLRPPLNQPLPLALVQVHLPLTFGGHHWRPFQTFPIEWLQVVATKAYGLQVSSMDPT